jgi:hypothetical protein
MHMRGVMVGLMTVLLSGGCTSEEQDCAFLAPGYARLDENLARLPAIPSSALPESARFAVERCYPTHPYNGYLGPFSFLGAKRAANGNTYLLYEPMGITDVQLVFEFDRDQRPLRAFQYNTL